MYVSFFIEPLKGQEAIKSVLILNWRSFIRSRLLILLYILLQKMSEGLVAEL